MDFRNNIYIYLETIIKKDSLRYITPKANKGLSTQKPKKWERRDDLFSCQYCTKSVCLDIKKKINVLEKLHLLVRTLNMNDDDNHRWLLPGNYPYFQKIW